MQGPAGRLKELDRRATSEATQIELSSLGDNVKRFEKLLEGLRMVQIKDLIRKTTVSKY
jgi:hypothetical protein